MLYYGNARNIQDQCVILNFTSYIEGYRRLYLLPPNSLGASSEYQFDQLYMQYIFSNDSIFFEFFSLITLLNEGKDIYIIVSDDDWSQMLIESLLKLIQQRYGYNGQRVNCFDDVIYSTPVEFNKSWGILNYDEDAERYATIVKMIELAQKGHV